MEPNHDIGRLDHKEGQVECNTQSLKVGKIFFLYIMPVIFLIGAVVASGYGIGQGISYHNIAIISGSSAGLAVSLTTIGGGIYLFFYLKKTHEKARNKQERSKPSAFNGNVAKGSKCGDEKFSESLSSGAKVGDEATVEQLENQSDSTAELLEQLVLSGEADNEHEVEESSLEESSLVEQLVNRADIAPKIVGRKPLESLLDRQDGIRKQSVVHESGPEGSGCGDEKFSESLSSGAKVGDEATVEQLENQSDSTAELLEQPVLSGEADNEHEVEESSLVEQSVNRAEADAVFIRMVEDESHKGIGFTNERYRLLFLNYAEKVSFPIFVEYFCSYPNRLPYEYSASEMAKAFIVQKVFTRSKSSPPCMISKFISSAREYFYESSQEEAAAQDIPALKAIYSECMEFAFVGREAIYRAPLENPQLTQSEADTFFKKMHNDIVKYNMYHWIGNAQHRHLYIAYAEKVSFPIFVKYFCNRGVMKISAQEMAKAFALQKKFVMSSESTPEMIHAFLFRVDEYHAALSREEPTQDITALKTVYRECIESIFVNQSGEADALLIRMHHDVVKYNKFHWFTNTHYRQLYIDHAEKVSFPVFVEYFCNSFKSVMKISAQEMAKAFALQKKFVIPSEATPEMIHNFIVSARQYYLDLGKEQFDGDIGNFYKECIDFGMESLDILIRTKNEGWSYPYFDKKDEAEHIADQKAYLLNPDIEVKKKKELFEALSEKKKDEFISEFIMDNTLPLIKISPEFKALIYRNMTPEKVITYLYNIHHILGDAAITQIKQEILPLIPTKTLASVLDQLSERGVFTEIYFTIFNHIAARRFAEIYPRGHA